MAAILATPFPVFDEDHAVSSERATASLSPSTRASRLLLDLRVWASEAMDVLHEAECAEAADPGPASAAARMRCRHRLSALIERASFVIPDCRRAELGPEEAAGPRVIWHPAVGYLVAAERVMAGAAPHFAVPLSNPREALRALRRAFLSDIEDVLDPRIREGVIEALLRPVRAAVAGAR
jgi:hypothetical protein